jgi:hypothetical protein
MRATTSGSACYPHPRSVTLAHLPPISLSLSKYWWRRLNQIGGGHDDGRSEAGDPNLLSRPSTLSLPDPSLCALASPSPPLERRGRLLQRGGGLWALGAGMGPDLMSNRDGVLSLAVEHATLSSLTTAGARGSCNHDFFDRHQQRLELVLHKYVIIVLFYFVLFLIHYFVQIEYKGVISPPWFKESHHNYLATPIPLNQTKIWLSLTTSYFSNQT